MVAVGDGAAAPPVVVGRGRPVPEGDLRRRTAGTPAITAAGPGMAAADRRAI